MNISQAPADEAGPLGVGSSSTPQQMELPPRATFRGTDAEYIQFLRTRIKENERDIRVLKADAAVAKSKCAQSVAREEFYVEEMKRVSRELLCKCLLLSPRVCLVFNLPYVCCCFDFFRHPTGRRG